MEEGTKEELYPKLKKCVHHLGLQPRDDYKAQLS